MSLARRPQAASRVIIVGGGGFARETLDVIEAHNAVHPTEMIAVVGVVDGDLDDHSYQLLTARGIATLGSDRDWLRDGDHAFPYLLAIGDPSVKQRIDERYLAAGLRPHPGVVHPAAVFGSATVLGEGTVVCAGVQISTNVATGRHVHLNPNATVGHDARLADYVSVNPAAVISGHVKLETGALIGAGAVILERRSVGAWSTVGAAACVVRNVPSGTTVKGVPAQ
jgi:sugar O-acyltransferase, sialic acid O-acetyltransferase NeuD family